ncbi:cytosolic beta-glucosidase [Frankliniella occidentalis]|uniref:Cytosolic beta-glucosidase n=1 Tax=Frankliniella occidentalis TaxID=133901 RepID=A0A6J1S5B4_FRAOC|nr:cytosolic beta-glucosidase [Frankliniella occidentalis]
MAGRLHLVLILAAVVLATAVEGTLRTKPRLLKPRQQHRLGGALGAATTALADLDCNGQIASCSDCTTKLTCVKLLNIFRPLSTTACPASTPYCVGDGQCSATPENETCRQQADRATDFTCVGDGYFPSPANCRKYYYCADNVPYEYDCTPFGTTIFGAARAMCVPTTEATCSVASCTTANIGAYQQWRADRSVYFVCTDTDPAHAYVADCGDDRQIDAQGDCVLTCTREGRIANPDDKQQFYECVQTTTTTFVGPTAKTCPGTSVFDATTERCVTGSSDPDPTPSPGSIEDYYAPTAGIDENTMYKLPDGFRFGASSAAYQVEGGWNADDKSPSIWDSYFHQRPGTPNGDVACDSYTHWDKDIEMLKALGLNSYRFSLSWTRILPDGDSSTPSLQGVAYYQQLIQALKAADIEPIVTVHHWDIPNKYQEYDGGWLSENIIDRFVDYADFVFGTFGNDVKTWVLMNEPHIFCSGGYETGSAAPGVSQLGTGAYQCVHNMILAHAKAYHLYSDKYRLTQQGKIGSSLDIQYAEPATDSQEDKEAAERAMVFGLAWIADPLIFGDYPQLMKDMVLANSLGAGLTTSRLPSFTEEQKAMIKGTLDFMGINHYTTTLTTTAVHTEQVTQASYTNDTNTVGTSRPEWQHSARYVFAICPWGLRGTLNWLKARYSNIAVFITENGYGGPEDEGLQDPNRTRYYSTYLRAMLRAIHEDGCNVIGYTAWSLLDNLEWTSGYTPRFGLVHVDFNDPQRTRTLKESSKFFQEIKSSGGLVKYYE